MIISGLHPPFIISFIVSLFGSIQETGDQFTFSYFLTGTTHKCIIKEHWKPFVGLKIKVHKPTIGHSTWRGAMAHSFHYRGHPEEIYLYVLIKSLVHMQSGGRRATHLFRGCNEKRDLEFLWHWHLGYSANAVICRLSSCDVASSGRVFVTHHYRQPFNSDIIISGSQFVATSFLI